MDVLTATPTNGGTNPTYTWYKNGFVIGVGNNATDTVSGLVNNDSIWVVMLSNEACVNPDTAISNRIVIHVTGGDSIWPGDVDRSSLVDLNDLLPLGVLYGKTGPARSIVDISWNPHYASDWLPDTFGYSFNDKIC